MATKGTRTIDLASAQARHRRVYSLRFECGTVTRIKGRVTLARAEDLAVDAAQEGWEECETTHWHDVAILDSHGEEVTYLRSIPTHPSEPRCSRAEHAWHETSVRGNGAGIVYREKCSLCGAQKITDTWAARGDTGEQGLTSVRYERSDEGR